ncbi:hypothetical protein FJTKL_01238 [Diaporthe vaccinii]|uniref:DUF6546 domain-containing protein n=1 Tax=Diaporthe vaccinii TaxID=105482 RepID=A0ABR4F5Z7_9PEZI
MTSEHIEIDNGGWNKLPTELRDMILERCTWQSHGQVASVAGTEPLAVLATVCRSWQDFFEGKLFQRLTLETEADIEDFHNLVQGRRRAHVEWIWLSIELPMYDCQQCHRRETYKEIQDQNATFTKLVWNLFTVLFKWENKEVRHRGITLELSAHSPSDAHHFNKNLRFHQHDTAWNKDDGPVSPHNDPFHGWEDGIQIKRIPVNAKYRLFGSGLEFDCNSPSGMCLPNSPSGMCLPKVSVVTCFIIRRQSPRFFNAKWALRPMIHSLIRLSSFTYEPWRGPTISRQREQAWLNASLAKEALKSGTSLKKVSIFESHDGIFYRPTYESMACHGFVDSFSRELARSSHHLEELHAANNVDAFEFFYAFQPQASPEESRWMVWKDLKYLSLTTLHLFSYEHDSSILLMAARAAERMPKLEMMELWDWGKLWGPACIFRFRRDETEASIELVSTWPWCSTFSEAQKAAWTRVATANRPLPLHVKEGRLHTGGRRPGEGVYCVLRQLELVDHVLHPISLRQIARDDQRRREEIRAKMIRP